MAYVDTPFLKAFLDPDQFRAYSGLVLPYKMLIAFKIMKILGDSDFAWGFEYLRASGGQSLKRGQQCHPTEYTGGFGVQG